MLAARGVALGTNQRHSNRNPNNELSMKFYRSTWLVMVMVSMAAFFATEVSSRAAITNIVQVRGPSSYVFSPTNITISTGDSIRWTNVSSTSHDITPGIRSGAVTNNPATPQWAPTAVAIGGTFQVAFSNVGVYPYLCGRHVFGIVPQLTQTGTVTVVQANLLPTVALTSPANLTALVAPASFLMSAEASDGDGSVTKVEFFDGGTLLGSASSPPYEFNVVDLPAGWHQLTARATDDLGGSSTTEVVNVLVNSNRTVVVSGFAFSPSILTVTVGDTVTFNGLGFSHTVTGSSTNEAFCGTAFPGTCQVTFNRVGNFPFHCNPHQAVGMTGLVSVVGPNLRPVTTLTSPASGSVFAAPATIDFAAEASDLYGAVKQVRFVRGGTSSQGVDTTSPYALSISNVPVGNYVYTALVTDDSNLTSASPPVNVTVVAPVDIQLLSPAASLSGFTFDYTANPGLTYIVEGSAADGLPVPFVPLSTNRATTDRVTFTDPDSASRTNRAYRVLRQR